MRRTTVRWFSCAALASAVLSSAVSAGGHNTGAAIDDEAAPCRTNLGDLSTRLLLPYGIAASRAGPLIADAGSGRVLRARPSGLLRTVAGSGVAGFSGDDGPATAAQLQYPTGIALSAGGGFLVADNGNHRVRRVSQSGRITTVAGTGTAGFSGDGGPASGARLAFPGGLAPTADGGFLVADTGNHRVRFVSPFGTITTVAGTGTRGDAGDGGGAVAARLNSPTGVAVAPGAILIADSGNHRIRAVDVSGTIRTVAGDGTKGFSGDRGPATAAELDSPSDVAPVASGGFLVADTGNARIRRVSGSGVITTVAGTRTSGFSGDGGPATAAQLASPSGVAAKQDDGFLIADTGNNRVRRVSPGGIISSVGGCGVAPSTRRAVRQTFVNLSFPSPTKWKFGLYRKPIRARPHRPIKVRYVTDRTARVAVVIRRRHKRVRRAKEKAAANVDYLRVRSLPSGRYSVRVRAKSRDLRKRDRTRLRVRR